MSRRRAALVPEWLGRYFANAAVVFDTAANAPLAADPQRPRYATDDNPSYGARREPFLPGPSAFERPNHVVQAAFAQAIGVRHGSAAAAAVHDEIASGRDAGFDDSTDAESRAIARRFAPANVVRPAGVAPQIVEMPSEEPAPAPQPKAKRTSGLFAGLAQIRAASAYRPPSLNLLRRPAASKSGPTFTQAVLRGTARLLEEVLADFSIKGEVREIKPGPVVTLFELEPARGTKSSRVVALAEDIARSLSVTSARAAIVPGRNVIGIELPNVRRETVYLRDIFEAGAFTSSDAVLPLALGKSIGGDPIVADLARMPHLLVAGTTGSGKSVGINAMILSLLYRRSPEECRLLMIDPKMLELSVYNGIPHLLTPVVTDPHKAVAALNWAVAEMEERYKRMAALSVRNIEAFNARVRKAQSRGEHLSRTVQTGFDERTGEAVYEQQEMAAETMPYIVVVVDEFADLMIVAGKEIEGAVQRLAQMARAAGIHLIMATQRPSVDIVTGTIKANFPARISFKVASKIDSRTILNEQGAEQLLGQGDMLYSLGMGQIIRAHGPFVSDEEVERIAEAVRRSGAPHYVDGITDPPAAAEASAGDPRATSEDDLYDMAVAIVLRDRKASTSYIQRRLSIGYNRAADLIERMETEGLIGAANSTGRREILITGRDGGGARAAAG
jgi:S-DNA-T family DNA segregation ATPase FtsK/SpoIIIE